MLKHILKPFMKGLKVKNPSGLGIDQNELKIDSLTRPTAPPAKNQKKTKNNSYICNIFQKRNRKMQLQHSRPLSPGMLIKRLLQHGNTTLTRTTDRQKISASDTLQYKTSSKPSPTASKLCLCWENTRGRKGPWSEIQSAIIP
jgi:hypothetical protein